MSRNPQPSFAAPVAFEAALLAGSPEALRQAALDEVEVVDGTSPEEQLGQRVEAELDRCAGMLFTATPRTDLLEVARWQRLADEAWAGQVRHVVAATARMTGEERDFAGDEFALALGISPTAGRTMVWSYGAMAALPGLIEAVECGRLTQPHVRALMRVLDEHGGALTLEQRQSVALIALARYADQTPGAWAQLIRRLVLALDPRSAADRKEAKTAERRVTYYPLGEEQAALHLEAPLERVAAVEARIQAEASRLKAAGDPRTMDQLRCDISLDLLTHGVLDGQSAAAWSVAVIVPLSTLEGGDLEVAEIPGWGPVLPSTGRALAEQAVSFTQVAVDEDGQVLAVSDPRPVPTSATEADAGADGESVRRLAEWQRTLADAVRQPPVLRDLASGGYRVGSRLRRFLEARDRTCAFPGCTRPASRADKDHAIPWPVGPTSPANVHCLCRRHHRAKQSTSFTVVRLADGSTVWITRGQWWFRRQPPGY